MQSAFDDVTVKAMLRSCANLRDGTSQLATAMATFINGSMNHSGVTSVAEMQTLTNQMNQLATSGGHL